MGYIIFEREVEVALEVCDLLDEVCKSGHEEDIVGRAAGLCSEDKGLFHALVSEVPSEWVEDYSASLNEMSPIERVEEALQALNSGRPDGVTEQEAIRVREAVRAVLPEVRVTPALSDVVDFMCMHKLGFSVRMRAASDVKFMETAFLSMTLHGYDSMTQEQNKLCSAWRRTQDDHRTFICTLRK